VSFSCFFEGAQLNRIISGYPKTGSGGCFIQLLHLGSLGYPKQLWFGDDRCRKSVP
jgi:hypothetical protein